MHPGQDLCTSTAPAEALQHRWQRGNNCSYLELSTPDLTAKGCNLPKKPPGVPASSPVVTLASSKHKARDGAAGFPSTWVTLPMPKGKRTFFPETPHPEPEAIITGKSWFSTCSELFHRPQHYIFPCESKMLSVQAGGFSDCGPTPAFVKQHPVLQMTSARAKAKSHICNPDASYGQTHSHSSDHFKNVAPIDPAAALGTAELLCARACDNLSK